MTTQAIAICRVSTPEQKLSNSLNRQEASVKKAASDLGVEIIKWWSGDVSSKVGNNVKRKDLMEAFEFCKSNRRVKYLLVDEVDRFMRAIEEMFYWKVYFKTIGVKVYFASNPELNAENAKASLFLSLDGFKAQGSNEERQHKSVAGHEKAINEGRYTFPPKPGYMKGEEPGVHLPHPDTFEPLKTAFKEVLTGIYSPLEALKRLNKSEFSKVHARWNMDKFRKFGSDPYYAGILVKDKQVKARNNHGRHKPMLTQEEHEVLTKIFNSKYRPRGVKKQYNPDFPMNKIMICGDCDGAVKFTGSKKSNGLKRKTTKYYWKYECRGCHRSYHRDEVHGLIKDKLEKLKLDDYYQNDFIKALEAVWNQRQQDKVQEATSLQKRLVELQNTKSSLIREFTKVGDDLKTDLTLEIEKLKFEIVELEAKIDLLTKVNSDLVDFIKFGLNYTQELIDDWWDLDYVERVQCQQALFPGGITFSAQKIVGTPQISPIYTLKPIKKAPDLVSDAHLVELMGIAPMSVSFKIGFLQA